MKIFLCGQKSFGLDALLMIKKRGDEIVGVSAPPMDGKGRTDKLFGYADAIGLPVVTSDALRARDIPPGTDLIVCAHAHVFIGRKTRQESKLGAIGYHPSLLPRHRGRDAVRWTIKMHDAITGGSVYWLNDSIDGGDIAAQEWCFIHPGDTASSLWREQLYPLGIALLHKVIGQIENGKIVRVKQDESIATFEPAMNPPRLFRPELIQLGDGSQKVIHETRSEFGKTMDFYSLDRNFNS